jgi:hypothetical protein
LPAKRLGRFFVGAGLAELGKRNEGIPRLDFGFHADDSFERLLNQKHKARIPYGYPGFGADCLPGNDRLTLSAAPPGLFL